MLFWCHPVSEIGKNRDYSQLLRRFHFQGNGFHGAAWTKYLNCQWIGGRAVAIDDNPFLINQELGEIPLYPGAQEPIASCFEEPKDWRRIWPIHSYLHDAKKEVYDCGLSTENLPNSWFLRSFWELFCCFCFQNCFSELWSSGIRIMYTWNYYIYEYMISKRTSLLLKNRLSIICKNKLKEKRNQLR